MTPQHLKNVLHDTMMHLEELEQTKGAIYARVDRAHNFIRGAEIKRESPEKTCLGMWTKQLIATLDIIDDIERQSHLPTIPVCTQERLDEVIDDLLLYLLITKALIYWRYGWTPKSTPVVDEQHPRD